MAIGEKIPNGSYWKLLSMLYLLSSSGNKCTENHMQTYGSYMNTWRNISKQEIIRNYAWRHVAWSKRKKTWAAQISESVTAG